MRGGIDAARAAGDDLDPASREVLAEAPRNLEPALVAVASTDHGHASHIARQGSANVEQSRRLRRTGEKRRIALFTLQERARARLVRLFQRPAPEPRDVRIVLQI